MSSVSNSPKINFSGRKSSGYLNLAMFVFVVIYMTAASYFLSYTDEARFPDRENYSNFLNNIVLYGLYIFSRATSFLNLAFSEPIWHALVFTYSRFSDDPEIFLFLISAFSLIVNSKFILLETRSPLLLIFLINPLFFDLAFSQVRSIFAFSLLILALMTSKVGIKTLLIIAAPLIHTAMIVVLAVYFIANLLARESLSFDRKLNQLLRVGMTISSALLLSIVLSFAPEALLTGIDRRADDAGAASSFMFITFWVFVGIALMFSAYSNRNIEQRWILIFVAITMIMVFFMACFSAPGQRFISLLIPFYIVGIKLCQPPVRMLLFILLTFQTSLHFIFWL